MGYHRHLEKQFCFWDSQTYLDTILMIFDSCVAFVLLVWVIISYRKARIVLKKGVQKFYILMILWGLTYLGKEVWGIVVFFNQYWRQKSHLGEDWMHEKITLNSKIYQLIESFPGFIIQTLLLLIPLHILGNMLDFELLKEEGVKKVYRMGHKYLPFRFFIFLPSLLVFLPFDNRVVEGLNLGKGGLFVIDGFICLYFLLFVRRKGTQEYQPLDSDSAVIQSLSKQLRFLIIAAISRVSINIVTYYITPNIYIFQHYKHECFYGQGFYDGDVYFTVSDILLADYLMHFLPIYIIRKMYEPPAE